MKLVNNWPHLWKSLTYLVAALGIVLPYMIDFAADHSDAIPCLTPEWRNFIRVAALALIPLVRAIKQPSVNPPKPREIPCP